MTILYATALGLLLLLILVIGTRRPKVTERDKAIGPLFALGNTVAVFEALDTDHNWSGTIVGMKGDTISVRDIDYPYSVAELPRADIFPLGTEFHHG